MTTQIITTLNIDDLTSLISTCIADQIKLELKNFSTSPETNSILTRQETAKLLTISLPTLHDYTKRGLIKAYRLGTKVRYKKEEVEAALLTIRLSR